jgi:uroporphyrin-3 C-methyltransferase
MTDVAPTPPSQGRRVWLWPAATSLVLAAVVAAAGWYLLQQRQLAEGQSQQMASQMQALEQSLQSLRADQRANARTLQDAASGNRLLRDEVLGVSQRNALLEENVARLSADTRQGLQLLRQEEVEVMLGQALQRLEYGHDLDSARRLYALAENMLQGLEGPGLLDLRQSLRQERSVLDTLGPDPRLRLASELDGVLKALLAMERQAPESRDDLQWWQRVLSPLVDIHRSDAGVLLADSQRVQALDSLQLEVSLARAALERADQAGWERALGRISDWVGRLWPDGPARQRQQQALTQLRQAPLTPVLPELGSTLRQMRQMRDGSASP